MTDGQRGLTLYAWPVGGQHQFKKQFAVPDRMHGRGVATNLTTREQVRRLIDNNGWRLDQLGRCASSATERRSRIFDLS